MLLNHFAIQTEDYKLKYIFLSGIHGVGKSTLSKKIQELLDIQTVTVSNLIKQAGKNFDSYNKETKNISKNQELWKNELNNLDLGKSKLLLDGHFCLLDSERNIVLLPFETFNDTNMDKIIVMKNRPELIRDRLFERDQIDYSIDFLQKFQDFEIQQSISYSNKYDIKLFIYDEKQPLSNLLHFITS